MKSYNYLPQNTWRLQIESAPELQFYVQEVSIPSVNVPEVDVPGPGYTLQLPGDKIEYGTLDCTFILDDKCDVYEELFNWLKTRRTFSDIVMYPMSGTTKIAKTIKFSDCVINNLGTISFNTTSSDVDYLTCSVSFAINDMNVVKQEQQV